MFPRFLQLFLVCLLALTAWSAADAHSRIHDALVGDGVAVMADAGEERDAADDLQGDGDAQTQVDPILQTISPCSPRHGRWSHVISPPGTRITRRQLKNAT
ncbi:hypothetical protein XPR_3528 [Xanthomonas arboricola pv. pruni MAFF 301420]|uniref:Secreted protein n=2 Tax=Xanthomonas arboricola pv. pruni TaxID=69929 RepID=W4SL59_9XANT|nr:hypothetical protein XPU_1468 [Xanthomonas arboricola pv. pruni str. MAFF 311562]GAE56893.1 hypothetical protein XPR_3528 [Xanthomonas arboricola pv. pruni MAFF 301420]GAE60768.1 hypothetical protein XPN_2674 [Xanthomonas arboricola pv. pruni MAFF 301427]